MRVSPAVGNALRSIIREAATNAIRHSAAGEVRGSVGLENGCIRIEFKDDGRGFDPEAAVAGNGLRNIRDRMDLLDGSFELRSSAGGTVLEVGIPVQMMTRQA